MEIKRVIEIEEDILKRIDEAKSVPDMFGTDIVNGLNAIKYSKPYDEAEVWRKSNELLEKRLKYLGNTQGDCISREALKNVILNDDKLDGANANWEVNRILVHIDNAQTVEPFTQKEKEEIANAIKYLLGAELLEESWGRGRMRLGDLDALKEAIEEVKDNYDGYEPNDLGKFMNKVDDLIDNAPTVKEVSEIEFKEPLPLVKAQKIVKTLSRRSKGVWISRSYYRPSTKQYDCKMTICSECKEEYSYDSETGIDMFNYSFCPNCGADMRGEKNNE